MKRRATDCDLMTSDPRERGIDLLLAGATTTEVAAALGVHRSTVWRWLHEPDVVELMGQLRDELRTAVRARLEAAAVEAVAVLCRIMADDCAPHAARVRAAEAVLDRVDGGRAGLPVEAPDPNRALAVLLGRLCES